MQSKRYLDCNGSRARKGGGSSVSVLPTDGKRSTAANLFSSVFQYPAAVY